MKMLTEVYGGRRLLFLLLPKSLVTFVPASPRDMFQNFLLSFFPSTFLSLSLSFSLCTTFVVSVSEELTSERDGQTYVRPTGLTRSYNYCFFKKVYLFEEGPNNEGGNFVCMYVCVRVCVIQCEFLWSIGPRIYVAIHNSIFPHAMR